jgi:hypothetical protein
MFGEKSTSGKLFLRARPARDGSALVWAMLVAVVLLILIGVMATVAQSSFHGQERSQADVQAYYTARSVSELITNWLEGAPADTHAGMTMTDQQAFIEDLKDAGVIHESFSEDRLDPSGGGKMGRAEAVVSINAADPDETKRNTVIEVTVTGRFADSSETIVSTLGTRAHPGNSYQDTRFETFTDDAPFNPDAGASGGYGAVEDELNQTPRDPSPFIVGNESLSSDAYNYNTADQAAVDSAIPTAGSLRELTWLNHNSSYSVTLGTTYLPNLGDGGNGYDIRRLVTPKNGRWTLNPLQESGAPKPGERHDDDNNTRLTSLSMGDFEDMDLQIRLGGYNLGALKNGVKSFNSLLMFDFTDNAGSTLANPYVEYYHNNCFANGISREWHPQKWKSMTIYTQKTSDPVVNGGVDTRLVFGPYGHKYWYYLDYWNWGRYRGNPWYGQAPGDFNKAFPGNNLGSAYEETRTGMAYIPEYYGNDFRLFFLDDTNRDVLIIQGVNILGTDEKHSVVYSRRGVEIGGALVKSAPSEGPTTRNVNCDLQGMDYGSAPNYANYFPITTRYSQILYHTDIVLRAPNGAQTPRTSTIFAADPPNTGVYGPVTNKSDGENKKYSPTVQIIGGYIYVGDGQTLNITGGRTYPANEDGSVKKTLTVSPTSITVAEGGRLVLRPMESNGSFNVDTNIFVSGEMEMERRTYAKGSLIVKDGGVVTTSGVFDAPSRYDGDVFVETGGSFTIGPYTQITGDIFVSSGGALTIQANSMITGDVRCAGTLNIEGSFTLNCPVPATDNEKTPDIDESVMTDGKYLYHGIFIYDNHTFGTGTLNITNTQAIGGNSGKIHTFPGYAALPRPAGNNLFCNDRHDNNACRHWESTTDLWLKQGDADSPESPES